MKKLLIISVLMSAKLVSAACEDKFPYSVPKLLGDYTYLCRDGYAVIHDNGKKIPFVTYEYLTPEGINAVVERKNSFREDRELERYARSKPKDYKDVGKTYDRGHLANAQNASSDVAMFDTFLMSNIVPQISSFNRGKWKSLESSIVKKVARGRSLFVITGVIANSPYTTIGDGVVVPSSMFKVVIDKTTGEAISYLIPNEVNNNSYKSYTISVSDLTKVLGVNLVPTAPLSIIGEPSFSLK